MTPTYLTFLCCFVVIFRTGLNCEMFISSPSKVTHGVTTIQRAATFLHSWGLWCITVGSSTVTFSLPRTRTFWPCGFLHRRLTCSTGTGLALCGNNKVVTSHHYLSCLHNWKHISVPESGETSFTEYKEFPNAFFVIFHTFLILTSITKLWTVAKFINTDKTEA